MEEPTVQLVHRLEIKADGVGEGVHLGEDLDDTEQRLVSQQLEGCACRTTRSRSTTNFLHSQRTRWMKTRCALRLTLADVLAHINHLLPDCREDGRYILSAFLCAGDEVDELFRFRCDRLTEHGRCEVDCALLLCLDFELLFRQSASARFLDHVPSSNLRPGRLT
jgi:hypothetical protein